MKKQNGMKTRRAHQRIARRRIAVWARVTVARAWLRSAYRRWRATAGGKAWRLRRPAAKSGSGCSGHQAAKKLQAAKHGADRNGAWRRQRRVADGTGEKHASSPQDAAASLQRAARCLAKSHIKGTL